MTPKEAGIEGSKEIFFAVISTTITLVAVFFPIVFMQGTTGRLFREFSLVVTGAVLISAFAALTFTPMLATKMLVRKERQSWFYRATEPFFDGMNRLYARTLAAFMRRRVVAIPVVLLTVGMIWVLWSRIPSEMAPLEDRSSISINTRGAEGVTYEYIRDYTEDINRLVDSLVPEAEAHYGPRVERERQCPDFASGYCRPRPLADGDRRGVVESRPIQDDGPCFRAAAEYVRWPPEPDARAVRAAGDQSREAPAGTARIYGEGLREPRFPDGRRRSEVQQARGPHHDQPRQGRSDGRQYARHSRNPSVRPQRPAHGLFPT